MFRELIPLLAGRYHVLAPDYLGFGESDSPTTAPFPYSFERLTDLVEGLLAGLGVTRCAIYVQDYGAPIGWRLALRHPHQITAFMTQNGNGYTDGFVAPFWDPLWCYATTQTPETEAPLRQALTLDRIRWQYRHGVPDPAMVSPDAWTSDLLSLQRPGNVEVQLRLSATIPPMSSSTRICKPSYAAHRRPCSRCGGVTTRSSHPPGHTPSLATSPTRRSTPSTEGTSRASVGRAAPVAPM